MKSDEQPPTTQERPAAPPGMHVEPESPGTRRWHWWLFGLVVAALSAALVIWHRPLMALVQDRAQLLETVRGAGGWGPLVIVGLVVLQVVLAPLPGQAINIAAGYLYGFWLGALYSWLGLVLGSMLVMSVARVAGRPLTARWLDPALISRWDRLAEGKGLRFFFLIFLLPFMPDDLACFLAGLTRLPLPALILTAAVGRIPGLLTAVWAGAEAESLSWQGWLIAGMLIAAGLLVTWRYGERFQRALLTYINRRA